MVLVPSLPDDGLSPAPGMVVVASRDVDAGAVAASAGVETTIATADLAHQLGAHRDALARAEEALAAAEERLAAARSAAAAAAARLPAGLQGRDAASLRKAGLAVAIAADAAEEARRAVGERPQLDLVAAAAAFDADEEVHEARAGGEEGLARANVVLAGANALALLIVATRVRTPAVDPLFVVVVGAPLAALGFTALAVVRTARQVAAAARARSDALRTTGLTTMTGLAARHARFRAWEERTHAADAAGRALAEARRRWDALVGDAASGADPEVLSGVLDDAARTAALAAETERDTLDAREAVARAVPTLVIVDGQGDSASGSVDTAILDDLERLAARTRIVLLTGDDTTLSWARARGDAGDGAPPPEEPADDAEAGHPVGTEGDDVVSAAPVVDLRDRLAAGLTRLRSLTGTAHDPPDDVAASG